MKYRTILIDPPWQETLTGRRKRAKGDQKPALPYPTMTIPEIANLPIQSLADVGAHLWLWTTNRFIRAGFDLLEKWGFTYLAPITWIKPSGVGNWFAHTTQTMLFGYFQKCQFNRERYRPTAIQTSDPERHSAKPEESYRLIESISDAPRVELFARPWRPLFPDRDGWDVWGNEVQNTASITT